MTTTDHWFAQRLIDWQRRCGRHQLPWQQPPRDAYHVWLSEIMLQQTQVSRVIAYYRRFVARFPTVAALAVATVDEVLPYWSGLGYYSRCLNLHKTARIVHDQFDDTFPDDVASLMQLPGIGRSTAGAISALAFGKRETICDGNVKRVLARYVGIDAPPAKASSDDIFWRQAVALTPVNDVATYTQAIMDLGALVCVRSRPRCHECPVVERCVAYAQNSTHELPVRVAKKVKPIRHFYALIARRDDGAIWLQRRDANGFWPNLYAPPLVVDDKTSVGASAGISITHHFTHFTIVLNARLVDRHDASTNGKWLQPHELGNVGIAAPIMRLLAALPT